jgi:hypothetical protein
MLVALWVVGFEVGPGLHVGFHDVWVGHQHQSQHQSAPAEPGHAHGPGADHQHQAAPERDRDPDHGEQTVAHRGVASFGAPPPILVPAPACAGPIEPPAAVVERPPETRRITARQRGPPA